MRKIKAIMIPLLAASMLCACAAKETNPEATTAVQTATETDTETETETETQPEEEDIVDAIKIGANRKEVAYALNSDGLEVANLKAGENEIMVLQWYDVNTTDFIQATFENGKVIGKNRVHVETDSKEITLETFNQIQEGMAYEGLKEVTGSDGMILAETDDFTVYGWMAQDGASISVVINDDKVESVSQHDLK